MDSATSVAAAIVVVVDDVASERASFLAAMKLDAKPLSPPLT